MQGQKIFAKNIKTVHGAVGEQWLAELSALLEKLAALWDFRLRYPLPDLTYSFVALVEFNQNGKTAILKAAPATGKLGPEIKWLEAFKRDVPAILQHDENYNAFLMEHITPGISVKHLVKQGEDENATRVICQTIKDLHAEQVPRNHFKSVVDLGEDILSLQGYVDKRLISKAQGLFIDLSADKTTHTLLHGDLHHDNILQSGAGWKVIDPHGYFGDAAAEVGALIYNPLDAFPQDKPLKKIIDRRLKILAEMLPYDAQRMRAWAFCWAMLSAAWDIMGGETTVPELRHAIAKIITGPALSL